MVAIRRQDAERLGYDNAENWRALVNACLCDIAKGYKIHPDHLRWYAAFHEKEKSVHIHMVVFSSDPKEGYLTPDGIRQVKSAFARRIFQQDLLHVYEQKTEYRDTLGRDAERAMAELIAQMEHGQFRNERLEQLVLELAERNVARLSGGQRQKVYLAMALAQDTPVLLLDEPTTFLDIGCQLELARLMRETAAEGKAVVMVLHDLNLALGCAHRVAVMEEGRLRAWGTPAEIYAGGALEQVFGVKVHRTELEDGTEQYLFTRRGP